MLRLRKRVASHAVALREHVQPVKAGQYRTQLHIVPCSGVLQEPCGFYGCSNYPDCDYKEHIPSLTLQPQVSLEMVSRTHFRVRRWAQTEIFTCSLTTAAAT